MPNVYKTKQKDIISDIIKSFGSNHFTVNEVVEKISKDGLAVGRSTVYRFLEDLYEKGELLKYKFDEKDVACYQNTECKDNTHFHLKCTSCSKLFHAECSFLSDLAEHIDEHHSFSVDNSKIVLYGICENCKEK